MKVLEVGSLLLFGLLLLYTLIAAPHWSVATVRLAVDGGLFTILLVSLAIGAPFTLQYARERVPKEYWASPLFLATNPRITGVWGAAFAVMTVADAAAEYIEAIPLWIESRQRSAHLSRPCGSRNDIRQWCAAASRASVPLVRDAKPAGRAVVSEIEGQGLRLALRCRIDMSAIRSAFAIS
jgi:hypothetical protein